VTSRGGIEKHPRASAPHAPRTRPAFFGKWQDVPVYSLETLAPGQSFEGVGIIDAETTTIVLNRGDRVTVNALGWLDIELAGEANGNPSRRL
jgi:N-methylhydantoinase A